MVDLPHPMEALFFSVVVADNRDLLSVMYHPPGQGCSPLQLITEVNTALEHRYQHVMYGPGCLLTVLSKYRLQGLANHVTFPMHEWEGLLLDHVLSDLHEANVPASSLDQWATQTTLSYGFKRLNTVRKDDV